MLLGSVRRAIGSWLAMSIVVMALSACASGPMTMSEMVCCAEHHDDCAMAGEAESCCAPDLQSDMGVLAPERSDTASVADAAQKIVVVPEGDLSTLSVLDAVRLPQFISVHCRSCPRTLSTVLRI